MKMRNIMLALAGLGLAGACGSGDSDPQDAHDENEDMQQAGGEPYGNGNLVATPSDPSMGSGMAEPAPAPAVPTPTPEEAQRASLCEGIPQPEACPIAGGTVQRVQNIDGGVTLLLRDDPSTSMDQVQRRVRCFDATSTEHSADSDCVFSLPGVNSEVSEDAGKIRVRLLTTEASQVRVLRTRARTLTRRVGGTERGAAPAETTLGTDEVGGNVRAGGDQTGAPSTTGNDVGTGAPNNASRPGGTNP